MGILVTGDDDNQGPTEPANHQCDINASHTRNNEDLFPISKMRENVNCSNNGQPLNPSHNRANDAPLESQESNTGMSETLDFSDKGTSDQVEKPCLPVKPKRRATFADDVIDEEREAKGSMPKTDAKRKSSLKKSSNGKKEKKAGISFGTVEEEKTPEKSRTPRRSVGFAAEEKQPSSPKDTIPNVPSGSRPDWYEDLEERQINMFKDVFELLDKDGGGSIDARELYACLKELDIDISLEEIQKVLGELDADGNGEIDFDEFLYAMSMVGTESDKSDPDDKYNRRQTLFYTAITRFAMKNSLGDIERYYQQKMRQAPHVISYYTAGARLIGLNDRQLEQELRRMRIASKGETSPYAKPLPFVTNVKKPKRKKPQVHDSSTPQSDQQRKRKSLEGDTGSPEPDPVIDNYQHQHQRGRRRTYKFDASDAEIMQALQNLANSGNVIAKLPGVHLIPEIRKNIKKSSKTNESPVLCSSVRKKKKSEILLRPATADSIRNKPRSTQKKSHGWQTPRVERSKAPLPVIKVRRGETHSYTIDDVPKIREKVSNTVDNYYMELKQSLIKTADQHWDQLHTEEIPSENLRQNFREVYESYSPHTMKDMFTICPWIPGLRYTCKPVRSCGTVSTAMNYVSTTKAAYIPPYQMTKRNLGTGFSRPSSRGDNVPPSRTRTPARMQGGVTSPIH